MSEVCLLRDKNRESVRRRDKKMRSFNPTLIVQRAVSEKSDGTSLYIETLLIYKYRSFYTYLKKFISVNFHCFFHNSLQHNTCNRFSVNVGRNFFLCDIHSFIYSCKKHFLSFDLKSGIQERGGKQP